jgi:hypothetical protein
MENLVSEALNHRAVKHPYLKALANGEFDNMEAVLKDFASQYGFYSSWFPRYLTAVISKLENPEFRNHLLDNLSEESGHLHEEDMIAVRELGILDEWVQGVPHPLLFRRFQNAMGVDTNEMPGIEVEIWRDSFLSLIQNGSAVGAVGAIATPPPAIILKKLFPDIGEFVIFDLSSLGITNKFPFISLPLKNSGVVLELILLSESKIRSLFIFL